jgi:hypothetical protein
MPDKRSVGPPDWLLVLNRRHLEHVLHTHVQPYNRERPHRALNLLRPETTSHSEQAASRPRVSILWVSEIQIQSGRRSRTAGGRQLRTYARHDPVWYTRARV